MSQVISRVRGKFPMRAHRPVIMDSVGACSNHEDLGTDCSTYLPTYVFTFLGPQCHYKWKFQSIEISTTEITSLQEKPSEIDENPQLYRVKSCNSRGRQHRCDIAGSGRSTSSFPIWNTTTAIRSPAYCTASWDPRDRGIMGGLVNNLSPAGV